MKLLSQKEALERLKNVKTVYQSHIKENYEHKAKNCLTCEVQGVCCTDAHFVNVHITRLEAVDMQKELENLSYAKQLELYERVKITIETYDLKDDTDSFSKTFSCPLFEKGTGCLVHAVKPVPCIQHACYENKSDLPPDELQAKVEDSIETLNEKTYGKFSNWLPLPLWLQKINQ